MQQKCYSPIKMLKAGVQKLIKIINILGVKWKQQLVWWK